jgi:predicted NBD/HSP70 family sugar kinase
MSLRIGVDLGGTKTECIAFGTDGVELARTRRATPQGDYAGTIATIVALVDDIERGVGQRGNVGVATPGALSHATGRLKNSNSTCLNGRPLREDLERALERPVRIANDADCFTLSEATDGAAAGARCVFGVILGTGVGGGICVDGRLLAGPNGIAGEWGHNPLPRLATDDEPVLPCYCGRCGCVETWLSGPGMAADHARHTGTMLAAGKIARRAAAGDAACGATLNRYSARLARALAAVINILDPDVVVLGGGLSNIELLYDAVPRLWGTQVFCAGAADPVLTQLVRNAHGDSSGVRGAAWLWDRAT